jgi:predicted  nucleic acid-binding Zn-ribbon protein
VFLFRVGREEMEFLQEKIDKLEQKIQQDEERLLNEKDHRKCDTLQKFIDRNTATLRGLFDKLSQPSKF